MQNTATDDRAATGAAPCPDCRRPAEPATYEVAEDGAPCVYRCLCCPQCGPRPLHH